MPYIAIGRERSTKANMPIKQARFSLDSGLPVNYQQQNRSEQVSNLQQRAVLDRWAHNPTGQVSRWEDDYEDSDVRPSHILGSRLLADLESDQLVSAFNDYPVHNLLPYTRSEPIQQEDVTMDSSTRLHRISFDGRPPYPPMAPDGRSIPPPSDDWHTETIEQGPPASVLPTMEGVPPYQQQSLSQPQYMVPAPLDAYSYPYNPYSTLDRSRENLGYAQPVSRPWSPSRVFQAEDPMAYRAPLLQSRNIYLQDAPLTYRESRYSTGHADPVYLSAGPAIHAAPTVQAMNSAFSEWYVDQVIDLLVKPGYFRPGVGGSAEEEWGPGGREREGWVRVGRTPPDYSKAWGRMGMPTTPRPLPRLLRQRRPETEPLDPWNVMWNNQPKRSTTLVAYVHDMIQRMSISPTSVVTAVWFLAGLGLHEGDGIKGFALRQFLGEQRWGDLEAVEKRVATLGLLLAGKWLDDNSFLTKSW
jgi:hypothetical protein